MYIREASLGAGAQSVTTKSTVWVRSPLEEMKYLFTFIFSFLRSGVEAKSAALSSAPQHAMLPELGGKWVTECLNTRFPPPTLLCARYSVKLI